MTKELVKKPIDRFKAMINSDTVQEQFKNALGKHSDLFVASLIDVFSSGLTAYEPGLIIQEALKAAVLKLPISKSMGFAYIVPYKGKPQFQIGYKGMIQLTLRSGQLSIFNDVIVYEGEFKSYNKLTEVLNIKGKKTSDKVVGYAIYMELTNGFRKTAYWTKEEVISHALKKSPSYKPDTPNFKKSAWFTDFDAMAMKTVIRSINKFMPMSIEFLNVMGSEINENDIEQSEPIKVGFEDLTDKGSKTEQPKASKETVKDDNKEVEQSVSAENAHTEDSSKKEPTELSEEERRQIEEDEFNELIDS